jgi:hypothetical protein
MLAGHLAHRPPQLHLGIGRGLTWAAVGAAMLIHYPAGPTFRDPETLDQDRRRDPATPRGHHFPSANSFNTALSSLWSATIYP